MLMPLFAYAAIGLIAGVFGGLLGISGGFITVPCLFFLFRLLDFPAVYLMKLTIGTSLAAMIFNSLAASYTHYAKGSVLLDLVKKTVIGLVLGTIVGAFFGHVLSAEVLQLLFAAAAIILGVFLYRHKTLSASLPKKSKAAAAIWNLLGFAIGGVASIIGIGGGVLAVPTFIRYGTPIKKAVGTASVTSLIVCFVGALSYLLFGLKETYYPQTIGYIYLPAFAVLAVTTFLTAPIGAYIANKVSNHALIRTFSVAMVVIGVLMLFR